MSRPGTEFWRGKRVCLTGHTGFKGGWLSLWLAQMGAEVCGYALAPPTNPSFFEICDVGSRVRDHRADVRDAAALLDQMQAFRPDIVFHLAAQPLVRDSYAAPEETYATNVMGTVNVLSAVSKTPGIQAAVIVTSDKVYAESADAGGHKETDPLGGRDPYSASKAAAEICTAAFPLGATPVATVRSGNVIGGGDFAADRVVVDFFRAKAAGQRLVLRNPRAIRPWQHVLDPLCGYLLAAEFLAAAPPASGRCWNFGPGRASEIPVAALVEKLGRLSGGWDGFDEIPAPLHESPVLRLNAAKAAAELNWQPGWDLDAACAHTVAWQTAWTAGKDMAAFSLRQIGLYMAGGA
jgi:CDP-glucose 4,6-dehydratase